MWVGWGWLGGYQGCSGTPTSNQEQITSSENAINTDSTVESNSVEQESSAEVSVESVVGDATESVPEEQVEVLSESTEKTIPPELPYKITLFDNIRINSREEYEGKKYEHVRSAKTAFEFKPGSYAKVELVVSLDTTCFPFEKWSSDPRPAGHRWPPMCDAYDRNFEFVLNPAANKDAPPGLELVRAITPFGGPMKFAVDITHIANTLPGKHAIQVGISTYADGQGQVSGANGGWFVSAHLDVTPGTPVERVLKVIPLFDESYNNNESVRRDVEFTLPPGTKRSVLEYRVTGHGGGSPDSACIGHADEFCKRTHRLFADGQEFQNFIPWRSDCKNFCTRLQTQFGQVCKENPTGAIQSVEAPRANWCPGSLTHPITRVIPAFQTEGKHTFGYQIEKVAKGGTWRVSAAIIAYGE